MVLFNNEHTHAVLSFVASGHVVIFDAEARCHMWRRPRQHQRAAGQAVQLAVGHQEGTVTVEADTLPANVNTEF